MNGQFPNPSPDLVRVVRCRDCKYASPVRYDDYGNATLWECSELELALDGLEWYCADGERKEEDA